MSSVPVVVADESAGGPYNGRLTIQGTSVGYSGSFLVRGQRRLLQTDVIPAEAIPTGAPERMIFTDPENVIMEVPGLDANVSHELTLVFLSEIEERVVAVIAGDTVLEARLPLPRATVTSRQWQVPPTALRDGSLIVAVRRVEGQDAVLTSLTIRAVGSGGQVVSGPDRELHVPRLSPFPFALQGVESPFMDLCGTWSFSASPSGRREETGESIEVPGQWAQQGFTVSPEGAAAYQRTFTTPAEWHGMRVKLRCDAVYSDATIRVDGRIQGHHQGGFTAFEVDITDAVAAGRESTLRLDVRSADEADRLASGRQYAAHDLGGITRAIRLIALPTVHVAALHVTTALAEDRSHGRLVLDLAIVNEGSTDAGTVSLAFALLDPEGKQVELADQAAAVPDLRAGTRVNAKASFTVAGAAPWDVEHPNLYTLVTTLSSGTEQESVSTRVGFRTVEVRGNRLFLNGKPLKLRGVCRHEVHPTRGRSLPPGQARGDVALFARANVNFIRTSHYPPSEELLEACDEIGMLVEAEAPLCWSPPECREELVAALVMEMVEHARNHPSVVIWSIANECRWDRRFDLAARIVGALDPTRPRIFSHGEVDLVSVHYPGHDGAAKTNESAKPVLFDEYCHLNAYNRRELAADPGLRDAWGLGMARMGEEMRAHPGCLGGALWAGIDDAFFLPGGRAHGYGTWGPVDGWRRPKPEYWHTLKSYSPVRIVPLGAAIPSSGKPFLLAVENRSDFADLSEMAFPWKCGSASGIARASGAPGSTGTLALVIPANEKTQGELEIQVTGPRGFLIDAYRFSLPARTPLIPPAIRPGGHLDMTVHDGEIEIRGAGFSIILDAETGLLLRGRPASADLVLDGPFLTLVPLDAEGGGLQLAGTEPVLPPLWGIFRDWRATRVMAAVHPEGVLVTAAGAYAEATGAWEVLIDGTGRMTTTWDFNLLQPMNPRQTGVTFVLPSTCDTLGWKRIGQWSMYPDDHVGRTEGSARAFPGHPSCGLAGPRTLPAWPWAEDAGEYGSNDFRSTKMNIMEARLADQAGAGLRAVARGDRHAHAWMDAGRAHLMIADYANEGAESYLQMTRVIPDRPLPAGGRLHGSACAELVG